MGKGKAPGRVRYSWESRCRIVQAIVDGASPAAAAAAHGASARPATACGAASGRVVGRRCASGRRSPGTARTG